MSHHLYHTEALVLSSRNRSEANKVYTLFTRELGLVNVSAQGVRHLRSKLRYNLNTYQFVSVTLVRGRDTWRLVGARELPDYTDLLRDPKRMRIIAKISSLLERLIHGEEKNDNLFLLVDEMIKFLLISKGDNLDMVELLAAARIMYQLGYLTPSNETLSVVISSVWDNSSLTLTTEHKASLKQVLAEGITHAHL